jgi:hypothetical protein
MSRAEPVGEDQLGPTHALRAPGERALSIRRVQMLPQEKAVQLRRSLLAAAGGSAIAEMATSTMDILSK